MQIRLIEIENFRGIESLVWAPKAGMNCLIGSGDSTKTTILDAIELALTPRNYAFADDSDFYNLRTTKPIVITLSFGELPTEFIADDRYGLHLRGWDGESGTLSDEPADHLEDILSIRVTIEASLEGRWSIFNDRIAVSDADPPTVRYKDMRSVAPTRLGPFAEHHLAWGRNSVLGQLEESGERLSHRLADASRAAREAFKNTGGQVFEETVERVEKLSKDFSVPINSGYRADLDLRSVNISAGGITLHDGSLPLRRLGTGSAKLLVSALQYEAAQKSHIALIDEIENGLEPHRIARLLRLLRGESKNSGNDAPAQIFLTTHSPVVIRELTAGNLHTVQSGDECIEIHPVAGVSAGADTVQGYLRSSPEAFLARRILIGEGKTETGLLRGLDDWWTGQGANTFAFQGIVTVDGGGKDRAPQVAQSLQELGYSTALLLDSDQQPNPKELEMAVVRGAVILQWEDACATEDRLFLDLPWEAVRKLVRYAAEETSREGVLKRINDMCEEGGLPTLDKPKLSENLDTVEFRQVLGAAAKFEDREKRKKAWFKDISRAETVAQIIAPYFSEISGKPLLCTLERVREWIDGDS